MNAATTSSIALPGTGAKRLASPATAPSEPRRFIDESVRKVPKAEGTSP